VRSTTVRIITAAALLAVITPVLTSCQRGTTVQPNEAKTDIVDIVDRTTDAIGGDWTVRRGPALGKCPASADFEGVTWTYILDRKTVGDRDADLASVKELWDSAGITTSDYRSNGDDPIRSVIGHDGPTSSIEFLTRSDGYTVHGVSPCAEGDYTKMMLDRDD
jgi:hypothetical protein